MITFPLDTIELESEPTVAPSHRHAEVRPRLLRHGLLTLDPALGRAFVDGQDVALSAAEFALLQLLTTRRGIVMSKEAILPAVFDGDAPNPLIVDVLVLRVRSKLAKAGLSNVITTVWGRGYMVARPGDDGAAPIPPPQCRRSRPQLALVG